MPKNKPGASKKRKSKSQRQLAIVRRERKFTPYPIPSTVKRMLLDPCNAPLVRGLHTTSSGILSRHKTVYIPPYAETNGYLLWSPHYVDSVGSGRNAYIFVNNSSASLPANNATGVFYGAGVPATASDMKVGASSFVHSDAVSDYRLVSSCMRVTYTGTVLNNQGLLATIEGLPCDALLHGNSGSPATIDNLLSYCNNSQRIGLQTHEIRHRPDAQLMEKFINDRDSVIQEGNGTTASIISNEGRRFEPTFYGFVWTGLAASQLKFEFVQNIEWRPDVNQGITLPTPIQLHPPGFTERILAELDKRIPDWTTRLSANLARFAYGAGMQYLSRRVTNRIEL